MNDKTPLELAREIVRDECSAGTVWEDIAKRVAAALIERETPVEITIPSDIHECFRRPHCEQKRPRLRRYDSFCRDCGKRITWK